MNKTIRNLLFIVIAIVIVGLLLYPKFKTEQTGPQASSPQSRSKLQVEAKIIHPERIKNNIKITGAVLANESVAMRSEISGKVEEIYFEEGNRVKKGDLLLSINDDEMVAQLEAMPVKIVEA